MTGSEVREIFEKTHALREGHFLLSSGRHSREYWEKFWVLQYPGYVQSLCAEIASRYKDERIEVVMGPTTGGILLAFETARQLGVRALYAEKQGSVRQLRRGLQLASGTRILIVDDVMTTGGALQECIALASAHNADVAGSALLVDRSGGTIDPGCRLDALLTVDTESYSATECPLCAAQIPLLSPGTSHVS